MAKKLVFFLLALSCFGFTYDSRYEFDKAEVREQLLALVGSHIPMKFEVINPAEPGSQRARFLNYYDSKILPVRNELSKVILEYMVYDELIDAGLYDNSVQKAEWDRLKEIAYDKYLKFYTDPNWEKLQIEFGKLAQGLDGELAKVARMDAEALIFNQFPPEVKPLIEEEQKLNNEIDDISNTSPFKMAYQQNSALRSQVLSDFFGGKMSFEAASQQLEKLSLEGAYSYGRDVFTRGARQLDRIAEIRSIIAKSKGYKTHSDMQVASQSVAHAEKFKTKEKLLSFLEGLLVQTQEVTDRYYAATAKSAGFEDLSNLRPFQNSLLGAPAYLLMRDFFQKERFDDIWLSTMRESGFPQSVLSQIIVDGFPRENKNSHAYMRPIRTPTPKILRVDGMNLSPIEQADSEWLPSFIYILQNYDDDGLSDLTTAFHEGGHALDYSYQRDAMGYPSAYGYTETHSTTMESFIVDPDFLMAHGQTKSGEPITRDRVDLFIKRKQVSDLISFRFNAENAIFDIRLWDYDYDEGPLTFTQRAEQLADEMDAKYATIKWPKDLVERPVHANFITSHYRSGSVRYFGYVLAEVSAALMTEALLDRLERETGRRSLYQQAVLAPMLIDGIYSDGFKAAFPQSVEEFAGREFSPDNFTKTLIQRVADYLKELEQEPKE